MADLVVTISESVTINGALRGSSNTLTVADVANTFERVVTCPHSNVTTIATFNSNVYGSAGAIDLENTKYIRVTNTSTTAVMDLAIVTENTNYQVVMTASSSHLLCQADTAVIAEADTTPNFPTLEDITSIQVKPRGTDDANVEIFVAVL
jgi:hypothetical protein|tara:strand:- start:1067 stop:1516 length:450 start_codon:yes stop_codon:yes gene_type:complete